MKKCISIFLTIIIWLAFFGGGAYGGNDSLEKLTEWIMKKPFVIYKSYGGIQELIYKQYKEVDVSQLDYKWRWDEHYITLVVVKDIKTGNVAIGGIWFDFRECQDLVTPDTHQFTQWNMADLNRDGTIDEVKRFYMLYNKNTGYIAFHLPKGLDNEEWYSPPWTRRKQYMRKRSNSGSAR